MEFLHCNLNKIKGIIVMGSRLCHFFIICQILNKSIIFFWKAEVSIISNFFKSISSLSSKSARYGSLTENAQRHFQGSLFGCFEYVPYTALTIVLILHIGM